MSISGKALLFDISRATDAATLFVYLADALADVTITDEEREEIKTAITDRHAQLNSGSARHHTRVSGRASHPHGRWTIEGRATTSGLRTPDSGLTADIHFPS